MSKVMTSTAIRSASRRLFVSATALIAAGAFLQVEGARAVDDHADWDNVTIVKGQGTVTDTGLGTTTIDQHSMRAIGQAQELHIGKMGDVTINQNSKSALFVGRVIGNHSDPTQILGRLSADGRVMIIDRNGVFFGQDSQVDAAGIAVTTGDVADSDIMDGNENYTFQNFGNGEIVLEGTVNINDAGLASFVAPNVRNSGVINAKMGNVVIAGGEKVTLDLYGDGLVEVAVDGAVGNALLENKGTINAEGGSVVMTAQSARDVVDNVINNEGIVNVSSITQKGGKIILSGGARGKVANSGKLDASGTQGGSVKVTGQAVDLATASQIKANALGGQAGTVEVLANSSLSVAGKLQAQGQGKSGFIETSAPDVTFASGTDIKAGRWLLDPTNITVDAPLATILEGQLAVGDAEVTTPAAGADLGRVIFTSTVNWATANTFTANAIDDIYFNGGGGLNATGGGHVILNSGDDIRMFNGSTGIKTSGGNVTLNAFDEVSLRAGAGIDAGGGNIVINNQTGGFYGFAESLRTAGTGTITVNQVQDTIENPSGTVATIQNAIDAIRNTGTGLNTINVGAGTYNENVVIDHDHLALIGKAGDPTVPGAAIDAPLIQGAFTTKGVGIKVDGNLSDVTISGFRIDKFKTGIRYDIGTGEVIPGTSVIIDNNTITNVDQGIFLDEVADVTVAYNSIDAKNLGIHAEDFSNATATIENNVLRNTRGPLTGVGISIRDIGSDDELTGTVRRNDVSGFGAGIALDGLTVATPDNITIEQNFINGNVKGIEVRANSDAATAHAFNNDLSGNTLAVDNLGTGIFNASGNWFGTTNEAGVIAQTSGAVDVSPYLASGTDTDPATRGFQGDFATLYVTDNGAQTSGLINEAVGLVNPYGQIFVNDGLYTENVLLNKSLKLTGLSTAILNPEFAGEALITVTASDVNIDPLVIDGRRMVDYGIVASGLGTHGLIVDGNTFRNFKKGGILLGWSQGGNMNIMNNLFEGSMGHGIRTGTMMNGTSVRIADNTFGSLASPLYYRGIDLGRFIRGSSATISDNDIHAVNAAISSAYVNNAILDIFGNTLHGREGALSFHGIENGSNVIVSGNTITSDEGTAVKVESGEINGTTLGNSILTISSNAIEGLGGYGIDVYYGDLSGGALLNIMNNDSIYGLYGGIYVEDSSFGGVNVIITGNGTIIPTLDGLAGLGGISSSLGHGIALYNVASSEIGDNFIHDVGSDGVHIDMFGDSSIHGNLIDTTGDDGIEALNGGSIVISSNTIRNIGGVPVLPIAPSFYAEPIYYGDEWGSDAIHVRNVSGGVVTGPSDSESLKAELFYGDFYPVYIVGNDIDNTADDGIQVIGSGDTYIAGNALTDIGYLSGPIFALKGEGESEYFYDDYYGYGSVDFWGPDGIHVIAGEYGFPSAGQKAEIYEGDYPGDDYYYPAGNKTVIIENTIDRVVDDGIETQGVNDLLIALNTVSNTGDDGINILGYGGYPVIQPDDDSEQEFEVFLGPVPTFGPAPFNAVVSGNTVTDADGDGIQSSGYDTLEVTDNLVTRSYQNGLYISGFYNGYVQMQGNTFSDNGHIESDTLVGAGARFESGNIDMSDLSRPNFFVNTRGVKALGMQFDPAGIIYADSDYGYEYASIFSESFGPPLANLTIVNETLGSTVFDGFTPEGSFYVRFEDGAILDGFGNVIVIDGTNATFDGILPAATAGFLSSSALTFIENRLWDADDPILNGRGQIFVGVPADPQGLDNIQDFFNQFEDGANRANGLNVTFLGLPPIGPLGGNNIGNLNNIAPNAGGNEGEQPAPQPQSTQNLAGINPAAGGEGAEGEGQQQQAEQVGCWSDLTSALGTGKSATLADDGSPESAMAQAIGCGAQTL